MSECHNGHNVRLCLGLVLGETLRPPRIKDKAARERAQCLTLSAPSNYSQNSAASLCLLNPLRHSLLRKTLCFEGIPGPLRHRVTEFVTWSGWPVTRVAYWWSSGSPHQIRCTKTYLWSSSDSEPQKGTLASSGASVFIDA